MYRYSSTVSLIYALVHSVLLLLNGIIVYLLQVPFVDYWSEVEATMHGSLSIETTDFDNKDNYAVRKVNISDTKVRV